MCRQMTRTVEQYMALGYTETGARYLVAQDKGEAPPAPISRTIADYMALGHTEDVALELVARDARLAFKLACDDPDYRPAEHPRLQRICVGDRATVYVWV